MGLLASGFGVTQIAVGQHQFAHRYAGQCRITAGRSGICFGLRFRLRLGLDMCQNVIKIELGTGVTAGTDGKTIHGNLIEIPGPAKQRRQLEVHIQGLKCSQHFCLFILDGETIDRGTQGKRIDLHVLDHHLTARQISQYLAGIALHQTGSNQEPQQHIQQIKAGQNHQRFAFPTDPLPCLQHCHS